MILLAGQNPAQFPAPRGVSGSRCARPSSAQWLNGWSRSTIPARIPEFVARAVRISTQGRPGPVVDDAAGRHARRGSCHRGSCRVSSQSRIAPSLSDMANLQKLAVWAASKPIVIVGGFALETSRRSLRSCASPRRFDIPVGARFPPPRCCFPKPARLLRGAMSATGPNPKLSQRIKGRRSRARLWAPASPNGRRKAIRC